MGDEPTTTLTVAKLKALCVLNDLSASGKKAELLARLLEAGVDKETLGIEVFDETTATFVGVEDEPDAQADESVSDETPAEPLMLSLEDEDTMASTVAPAKKRTKSEPEVLEAEILEADLLPAEEAPSKGAEATAVPLPASSGEPSARSAKSEAGGAMTLMDMVRRPQAIAVLVTLLLLGAGGYY